MDIVSAALLAIALFWIGKIFYILQKSLNEIISGLISIDERLSQIEKAMSETSLAKSKN